MKKLIEHYKGDNSVAFIAVQTVFEGFHTNTFEKGTGVLKKFNISIPMGQDGTEDQQANFKTRGTPWTIIIDP